MPAPPSDRPHLRVLVVDDNKLVCDATRIMLASTDDLEFIGSLPSADTLLDVVQREKPDIVVLDLDMPGKDPVEVIRLLADQQHSTRVLVYTGHTRQKIIDRVFDAGAWGFVGKCETTDTLLDAVRRVAAGEVVVAPGSR